MWMESTQFNRLVEDVSDRAWVWTAIAAKSYFALIKYTSCRFWYCIYCEYLWITLRLWSTIRVLQREWKSKHPINEGTSEALRHNPLAPPRPPFTAVQFGIFGISGIVLPFWLPRVSDCFATQWVYLAGWTSSVMLAGGYVAPPLGVTGHRWTACLHSEAIYHRAIEVLWVWVILDHTWSHEVVLYVCKSWININLVYIVDMFYTNLCVLFIRIASRNIWPSLPSTIV